MPRFQLEQINPFSLAARLLRQLRCRHRWRVSRRNPAIRFCDLCGCRRPADNPPTA